MDIQRMRRTATTGTNSLIELPEYIITTFFPSARPLLDKHPALFRFVGILLALYYFGPVTRLQTLWQRFSSLLVATVTVSSDEDLFNYLSTYIAEIRTLRADQLLNATLNTPNEFMPGRRRRAPHDMDVEESARRTADPKIKYEQGQGVQLFIYQRRLFYVSRKYGEGHTYSGNRYSRIEVLSLSCLGRSTAPIKDFLEYIYRMNKEKERSLTVIRRPYDGGYGGRSTWSRLTSKPRRALDTVILDAGQKEQVLADVEEYMDETTMNFYASHGIPYRRGYLFHGPPGVGKTSFALALASKFNLDVYNLTLLDHNLTDSDLVSLLNQLPGRSLLLLEDIDTAGLSRKGKNTTSRRRRGARGKLPEGAVAKKKENSNDLDIDSDDDDSSTSTSRVTLSGLLNAIDGVAAPEGHILIMTTNKPHDLDDALVRAGRISVRVGFKNASKKQAEEIFLRMYVDMPSGSHVQNREDGEKKAPLATPGPDTARLYELARKFADLIPDHDFSPADLQDYLLVHKKDAEKALVELPAWMDEAYEERRRKEEEKEVDRELRKEAKLEERRRFREEVKAAVKETKEGRDDDEEGEDDDDDDVGGDDGDKVELEHAEEKEAEDAKPAEGEGSAGNATP
ncbi:hypothetical protein PV08_06217 [Exophiala spinifera]|uniref:AAA+ ATPase domain-containing protein n=1 Tax=Exophiala spinifera TaxID=91928 RepID=A0A0D1YMB9_9EURO|nr:uncharacterized protein PV08_06217 [Exophiala spinifera]KIW16166.1 hypothetical protein PV08_06217 [Exophiala spinifera]